MAVASASARTTEQQMPRRFKERETSPERTKVWNEPPHNTIKSSHRRVPVIYYLSRNGQLEHPHFMEVPLSSPDGGLYLTDVINRLNYLRGNGMASRYSWSSKRSYKNGYVWHDLCVNDFIHPAHGREYILKGSELLEGSLTPKGAQTVTSESVTKLPPDCRKNDEERDFSTSAGARRRHQSWSAFDFSEYRVYSDETKGRAAADASTQTSDKRRRRRQIREIDEIEEEEVEQQEVKGKESVGNNSTEVSTDEISPPPSDSSPETLEKLMKADGRIILRSETADENPGMNVNHLSGRSRASTVLMQLISCGSIGFNDCGSGYRKANGIALGAHHKVPRGRGTGRVGKDEEDDTVSSLGSGYGGRLKLEDKQYFSGSLIEDRKKDEFPALKRSSSYNDDRSSKMDPVVKADVGNRGKQVATTRLLPMMERNPSQACSNTSSGGNSQ